MSIMDKLRSWFGVSTSTNPQDWIEIDIPTSLAVKELAVFCATSLIGNAISQCEIKTYENGKPVKGTDYYSLNIKPNKNESASQFWCKVIQTMYTSGLERGALCFVRNNEMFCADDYTIQDKDPFKGNTYTGISVDGVNVQGDMKSNKAIVFKMESKNAYVLINSMYNEYGQLVADAMQKFEDSNVSKYKLKIEGIQAGDETFNSEFETYLKEPIQKFVGNSTNVLVEYDGRALEKFENGSDKNADDVRNLITQVFTIVGKAFKIPDSLMLGNITNMAEVVDEFLTFAVDPVADMIGKTLTAQYYTPMEFAQGNYYKVDTSKINHMSPTKLADSIDKLISSGFMTINEVRYLFDYDTATEDFCNKHILTKNYDATSATGKGEKVANDTQTDKNAAASDAAE
jgi:HK97 family phage portal protein